MNKPTMDCRHRLPLPSRRRSQRGVMLIEVLVSILIFSFGILGALAMHARAVQYSTNAEDRNRAALLANELVSTMWTSGTVNLPTATTAAWSTRVGTPTNGGLPGGSGAVVDIVGNSATVQVFWTPTFGGGQQRYETRVTL